MRNISAILAILLVALPFSATHSAYGADVVEPPVDSIGIIYIVFAIDTEPSRIPPWEGHPVLDFSVFETSGDRARIAAVMDDDWRKSYHDSFGGLPRFTWFVLSHEALFHVPGGGGTMVYDSMMKFADRIDRYGDEIGWHYHHVDWSDPDHDGKLSWNQLTTFDRTAYTDGTDIRIAERSLAALLVRRRFLPTVFRGGWTWENNDLSKWLENIIPYDFSAYPPNIGNQAFHEPLRNEYDWSRSPTTFRGYHPSRSDYQRPGRMHRWIFRTVAPNTEREWLRYISAAMTGQDQLFCYTAHSYDNLRADIDDFLGRLLHLTDSLEIKTRFTAASEAAAAVTGIGRQHPPDLSVSQSDSAIVIRCRGSIYQPVPYCAAVDAAGDTRRMVPVSDGPGQWRIEAIPTGCREIVCAVSNRSGESAVAAITIK